MSITDDQFALVSAEQRPDLIPAFAELAAPVWPAFVDGDRAITDYWDPLFWWLPHDRKTEVPAFARLSPG